jgi:hypothetical protein
MQVRSFFLFPAMSRRVVNRRSKLMRVGHHAGILRLRALMDDILFKDEENVVNIERNHFHKLCLIA